MACHYNKDIIIKGLNNKDIYIHTYIHWWLLLRILKLFPNGKLIHIKSYCGESDSENAPVITQSREDAEVRQICERRAGQRGNWTVEFIL